MSRYRRPHATGATFFFTVNTYRRQPLLLQAEIRAALREALAQVRLQMPFKTQAWVLMPEHLHCIWELPPGDDDFGQRWGLIKRHVTRACATHFPALQQTSASRAKRHEGALWQRRFWEHQIRDQQDFQRHADYIHWNPVKHGHVQRVADWPYSTFHRYVREGVYAEDWGGVALDIEGGREFGE